MRSPSLRLHLTLVTLKGQFQGHSDFKRSYLVKEASWAICYSEFLIQFCRNLPFVIPIAVAKQRANVLGALVVSSLMLHILKNKVSC